MLAQYGVSARKLVLCVPDRVALAEPAGAAAFARRVRALGGLVALDNFGQASKSWDTSASEHLLLDLPLDYVKFDGSLIRPLPYSGPARDALRRLLGIIQGRGVETVAVFVGGLSAIGAGLYSLGIPKDSIVEYESAVKAGNFVVVAHGTADEAAKAKSILSTWKPSSLSDHVLEPTGTAANPTYV